MTLIEFRNWFYQSLDTRYPTKEVDFYCKQLMLHFTKLDPIHLALNPDQILPKNHLTSLKNATIELVEFKPLQYILGESIFLERSFKVNNHVMVPRSETEELVQWINYDHKLTENIQIFDIGTGSGCIAISLALENPTWIVKGCDAYTEALKIAKQNAKKLHAKVDFSYRDILKYKPVQKGFKFNVIVSNPPYVTQIEKKEMQSNVLEWEPHAALFVSDENPLIFYRKIAAFGRDNLNTNGQLYLEINPKYYKEIEVLLEKFKYTDITFKKDKFNRIRMVKATVS